MRKKKNILFLTMLDLWSMGEGKGGTAFFNTIQGFIDFGWDVTIILPEDAARHTNENIRINLITFKPFLEKLWKLPKIGFIIKRLNIIYAEVMMKKIGKTYLRNININTLVYAYEVHSVKAARKLCNNFNLALVCRFQGTILWQIKNHLINRIWFYPHFHALKTKADVIIMTDDGTNGDRVLKKLGNQSDKIFFWKNGIDLKLFSTVSRKDHDLIDKLGLSQDENILLTVSRLVHWKRVDRAIVGFSNLIKDLPNSKLIIVGDGPEKESLKHLANNLGISDQVLFIGSVPHDNVSDYMQLCDVFVSLYDLSNVGNPLLEAMACGKPILTLNTGNTASIIKNEVNGLIIDLDQLDKLSLYMRVLLEDKALADRLGKSAREYALSHFWSWEERIETEIKKLGLLIN